MTRLIDLPAYRRVWVAATVSSLGSYVSVLALQVLAAVTLHANAVQLGLINSARWLPYPILGLLVGVITDRHRRRPVLVGTEVGRAAILGLIPVLYAAGWLGIWPLIAIVLAFGALSLFFDSADQSFLPRVVPRNLLITGFARLDQSDAAAQTVGPLVGAALVRAIGAPLAVLVDAVSYLASGLLLAGARVDEPVSPTRRGLSADLREGVAWVYRHRMLAPMALTGHLWFLAHGMLATVYVLYVLRDPAGGGLGLGTVALGVSYACAGVGAVLGGAIAGPIGRRLDAGRTMVLTRAAMPLTWIVVVVARPGPAAAFLVCVGLFLFWWAMGAESGNELGYRNAVTPDRLQGRMNTTIRSINRGAIVVGAPLGGLIADAAGYRSALWVGIVGLAVSVAALAASPFRRASRADAITESRAVDEVPA
jgi:MFS family permease